MGDDDFPRPKDLTQKDISVLLYPAHVASLLIGAFLISPTLIKILLPLNS